MLRSVKVSDYMNSEPVTFHPETALFEAIEYFQRFRVSGAPVVDYSGQLVGLLSEADCLRAILEDTYYEVEHGGKVGDVMTTDVQSVRLDTDIIEVAKIFIHQGRRRLPVVADGLLVGLISRNDILRAIYDFSDTRKA
ncbi:CBS domain-containing protein [Pokkaliibacter sp. MBI-7]|uniref:CBS domain-containing protein n=1 Tax=Pokkaliibacter sp. MBI-7 TaxID=3040600 RepID=UPI002447BA3D|nr:CBS domain-containing protein [Pokkaliibacter sp. MBI-7]MDH2431225.1 CBS domain-containing protein [Pokkaliibacter sp. MBI-7]